MARCVYEESICFEVAGEAILPESWVIYKAGRRGRGFVRIVLLTHWS